MFWPLIALVCLSPATAKEGVLIRLGGETRPATAAPAPRPSTARPISLDLVDADIHSVLRLIGTVSGLDFVTTDDVRGTVTVRLIDVPWDQALNVILLAKGLAATPIEGGVVVVGPPAVR